MALIEKLSEKRIDRPSLHKGIEATFSVFERDGKKLLQIDSYGRPDREIPGKVSQSLQPDANTAKQLMEILKNEFE